MVIETKVYQKNQITIPSEFRKKYDIKPEDIVECDENENGEIVLTFRKKLSLKDLKGAGTLKETTNAVELVNDLYK